MWSPSKSALYPPARLTPQHTEPSATPLVRSPTSTQTRPTQLPPEMYLPVTFQTPAHRPRNTKQTHARHPLKANPTHPAHAKPTQRSFFVQSDKNVKRLSSSMSYQVTGPHLNSQSAATPILSLCARMEHISGEGYTQRAWAVCIAGLVDVYSCLC